MRKILIVTQKVDKYDPVLGFFHRWIEEFSKHYTLVTVICLQKGAYTLPKNVVVLSLGKEQAVSRIVYLKRWYTYIWKYRDDYSTVFVHMNQIYILLGGLLWRLWGKRVALWYAHGYVPFSLRIAEKIVHTIYTSTIGGCRIISKKIKVVGQGIDTDFFRPQIVGGSVDAVPRETTSTKRPFRIVTVGRMSPVKDYETLIEAVSKLLSSGHTEVSLDIVGGADTPSQIAYINKLRLLVAERFLDASVRFIGAVAQHDVPKHLYGSSLFVNTSRTGSLDKTGLEAMAMEIPILTCNDSYKEFFGNDADIFMFSPGNIYELSARIATFLEMDDSKRREIGKQMRKIVVHYHSLPRLIATIAS